MAAIVTVIVFVIVVVDVVVVAVVIVVVDVVVVAVVVVLKQIAFRCFGLPFVVPREQFKHSIGV